MNYATTKLEFSIDPLSDTTPAWTNISSYCISASWQSGVQSEFDDPQAGTAMFVLKNTNRRFEPEYAAGAYYPNIVPGRRFRLTITADGVNYQQGIWYATEWKVEYPAGTTYSTTTVTCSDGFWRLARDTVGAMTPPSAESYADVVKPDNPFAFYPLNEETGNVFQGDPGPAGKWSPGVQHIFPNPIAGSPDRAVSLPFFITQPSGKAPLSDIDQFADVGFFSVEAVSWQASATEQPLANGPWVASRSNSQFSLLNGRARAEINTGATTVTVQTASSPSSGFHHHCATFDGTTLAYYKDGVLSSSIATSGIIQPGGAPGYIFIGDGGSIIGTDTTTISGVAFYTYALTPAQVAAHADAAITKGYRPQTSGTRIATIATDPLWSTAGIPAGTITAAPRYQTGQVALDEIVLTAKIDQPHSLFYFNDAGNPAYQSLQDAQTIAATFGEMEVHYDDIQLVYNDELFNTSTVAGPGLDGATSQNTQSISDYGVRSQDETDLPIIYDSDARLISQAIIDQFSTPAFRVDSITLNGSSQAARTQILTREVGDTIRVKRRGEGGTAIDVSTRILNKQKTINAAGDLRCTWTLARGFNISLGQWRLNVAGASELGQTTILA